MSVFRQFTDQFQSTFSAMPMSSRITTGLLAIIVFVGLGFIVRGNPSRDTEMLFGGRTLSEQELCSVEMSFSNAGLNQWQREGRRISIPIESRSEYLAALSNATSLPVSIRSSVQDAIEKTTIFESSSQRLARQMHAKAQDLGNKLTTFPEIRWASVEYDLGEREGLGRDRKQTASVVVIPEGGQALSPQRISDVKKFIGGSYAGMSVDDVVVIDTHASDGDGQATSFAADSLVAQNPAIRQQKKEQARVEQHISELLSDYGPIRIAAYVELATHRPDHSQIPQPSIADPAHQDDPSAIARVRSNRATSLQQSLTTSALQNSASQTEASAESIPALGPSLAAVTVSIGLPQSYYQRLWNQLYSQHSASRSDVVTPPPTSAQLEDIRQQTQANIRAAVTPALLSLAPHQPRDSVVEVYDFPDVMAQSVQARDVRDLASAWLMDHWQQIALLALGFLGLSVALKTLRNAPSSAPINRPLANQVAPQPSNRDEYETISIRNENQSPAQPTPPDDELLALIENDPDAAVDVIRKWVSEAA